MIFEANPDYYGDAPKMKTVTVLFMDEDAAYAAALSGQVDLAYTSAAYSDQTVAGFSLFDCKTVDNRGFNLPVIPAGETDENGVALGNDFTSDVSVRRAINLAINREEMIDHVLNGYGTVAYSVCDQMPWYNPAAETDYDPDMAKAILKEDGWEAGEDGILTKDGVRAEFTLMYPTGDSVRQALAEDTGKPVKSIRDQRDDRGSRLGYRLRPRTVHSAHVGMGRAHADGALQHLPYGSGKEICGIFPVCKCESGQVHGCRSGGERP